MRPKKVILLVDSDTNRRDVRSFLLSNKGYRVIEAADAAGALDVLHLAAPYSIDLLLVDLLLDGVDGNELARRAKDLQAHLPVLMVSNVIGVYNGALHADAFLPKGANSSPELLDRVRVLVARKRGPRKQVPVPAGVVAVEPRKAVA